MAKKGLDAYLRYCLPYLLILVGLITVLNLASISCERVHTS